MTQHPPHLPYSPTARPYPPHPLSHARRASWVMWAVATAVVLFGLCMAGTMPLMEEAMRTAPPAEAAKFREQMDQLERQAGTSVQTVVTVNAVLFIAWGGAIGLLAFFVRGGGRWPAVASIVVSGLGLGYLGLNLVGSLFMGGPAQFLQSFCVCLLPAAAIALQTWWLVHAARAAPAVAQWRAAGGQAWPKGPTGGPPMPWQGQPSAPQQGPAGGPPALPYAGPPSSPMTTTGSPESFGLLPPPPPGDGAGRYGYATRPRKPAEPPAAAAQSDAPPDPPKPDEGGPA